MELTITVRTGSRNLIKNNVMQDTNGIIVYADDNLIIGNDLDNSDIHVASGDCRTFEMSIRDGSNYRYQGCHASSDNAIVAGNDFRRGGRIEIGERFGGIEEIAREYPRSFPALDTKVGDNGNLAIRYLGPHEGTKVNFNYRGRIGSTSKLRSRDVGPSAEDRFCD